ncbi:lysophospholipid acyltransferase family protein [Sulfurimonas sp.]|uniref:lysophospholipid acyltransferase family protein n=1 Tax=Sulfurimonas sp. TaxID=2022749 RepID=UPI00356A2BFF
MRKKISRSLALFFIPYIASVLIRLIYLTNKKEFHAPKTIDDEPTIFACWHGELLMFSHFYMNYRKTPHANVLISSHFDGALISKTIKYFGLDTISGSSNRNAARVLMQGIKSLNTGYDIGITPDGPKGPRHEVADGIMVMARKTKAKVILVRIMPTKFWQFKSWDKFVVPKPFGTLHFYATEPLDVSDMALEDARAYLKERLDNYEI